MKIALITYLFPAKSETFIVEKAVRLSRIENQKVVLFTRQKVEFGYFQDKIQSTSGLEVIELFRSDWKISHKILFLVQKLFSHPIQFYKMYRQCWLSRKSTLGEFLNIYPILAYKPDLIHFEYLTLASMYKELLKDLASKKIVSCRGADLEISPNVTPSLIQEYIEIFQLVDKVHCLGPWLKNIAINQFNCNPEKIELIPPSIDIHLFSDESPENRTQPKDQLSVGTVARLHWKKGHIYALQATRILLDRGINLKYFIVGDGNEKERLLFDIHDLELNDKVKIIDWMKPEDVRDFLKSLDVFLLPSISEGFGNVVLEAMSMEKPVIVTNVGCADAITSGIEGIVVDRRNPEQIADAIQFLYEHPDDLIRMGRAGRKTVEQKYRIENQITRFEELYKSVVGGC